jgi:SynChlorMet cassette radical SAM/SPASM protein ScmE
MRTPRSVDIEITSHCNLSCAYCYFFDNPEVVYQDLPAREWLQFFEECGRLGVMQLSLAGGEPFYRKDLKTLLNGIVGNRMRYALLSNGGLITDDMASFIAATNRCDYVQISIDGSRPAIHDACRGHGSWKGAVRGIRTLKRHNVPMCARVTIHRYNVQDLEEIARLLLEDLELDSFGTNAAGYLGVCRSNSRDVLLAVDQRQQAMETLLRLDEKYPGRIMAEAGPLAEARMWHQMQQAKAESAPASADGGRLTGCGCTGSQIAIRADGTMVPCFMLPQIELGRINRDSLAEVWKYNCDLNALRERSSIPLGSFSYCAGCEYTPYCTGNCPGLAYSLTGEVNHPSPDACFRNFLAVGGRMPLEA